MSARPAPRSREDLYALLEEKGVVVRRGGNFRSVEQAAANYYAAKAIRDIADAYEVGLQRGEAYIPEKLLVPEVERPDLIELYHAIASLVNGDYAILAIASAAIEDMERFRFDLDPSVTSAKRDNEHLAAAFRNGYQLLAQVDLATHTLDVMEEYFAMGRKQDPSTIGVSLLGALLHDFGKSTKVRELASGNLRNSVHWETSEYYVTEILAPRVREKIDEVFEEQAYAVIADYVRSLLRKVAAVVRNHHSENKELAAYLAPIKRADAEARNKELEAIKERK